MRRLIEFTAHSCDLLLRTYTAISACGSIRVGGPLRELQPAIPAAGLKLLFNSVSRGAVLRSFGVLYPLVFCRLGKALLFLVLWCLVRCPVPLLLYLML